MKTHLRVGLTAVICGLGLVLAQTPAVCLAHGGGGHGGGGHGGGGHFGGGGHMGGGHFGGGHMGGGHMGGFSGGHMGGFRGAPAGGFNGGHIGGYNGGYINGGGYRGGVAPQMHSMPHNNIGGNQFRGSPAMGGGMRGFQGGGQGMVHHGVNLQSGHNFQAGRGFQQGISPNHGLYGRGAQNGAMLGHNGLGGAGRVGNGHQGVGALAHSAGRPVLYGNGGAGHHGIGGVGGAGGGARHSIGGAGIHQASFHNGAGGGAGHNMASFYGGHRGLAGNHGNWGVGRNGWNGGLNRSNWGANYRNVVINNNYYGWYGGAWGGFWGFGGFYPFWASSLFWGLGGFFSPWGLYGGYGGYGYGGWGYGYGGYGSYYNPYCGYGSMYGYASPLGANYYTQPVAVNAATQTDDPKMAAAFQLVEDGRALFLKGDYQGAVAKYDAAIPDLKGDPVVHELRALALFALGDYHEAAATLNALLAVAPGMDWASMRNQYPDVGTYTAQLRKLEAFIRENPDDAGARFVLGYHYLVTNFPDVALKQFQKVMELEPRDAVAKKMVETLNKGKSSATTPTPLPATGTPGDNSQLQTDMVGRWVAKMDDGAQFLLALDEGGTFTWTVTPPKGNPIKQTGKYTLTPDRLILDAAGGQNDTLMARVESRGPDHFRFWVTDDGSLPFHREGVNTPEPAAAAKPEGTSTESPIPPKAGIPGQPATEGLPVITLPSPAGTVDPADAAVPSNSSVK